MNNVNNANGAPSLQNSHHQPSDCVIDIRDSIRNLGTPCTTISRVPPAMRMNDIIAEEGTPKLISIGPFHRNNPSLQAMESTKLRFLGFSFFMLENSKSSILNGLEGAMKELEKEARGCYAVSFDTLISSKEFVRMMVIDGCFILEILHLHHCCKGNEPNPILTSRSMAYTICADLLMLENQLPFFVLQKLYDMTFKEILQGTSLKQLAMNFFSSQMPSIVVIESHIHKDVQHHGSHIHEDVQHHGHLLALFHFCVVPMPSSNDTPNSSLRKSTSRWFGTATELLCAGIKFRKNPNPYQGIQFGNRTLSITPLFLDEGATRFLHNMVAYEQCNPMAAPYFTTLVIIYDTLVASLKDFEYLRAARIIETRGTNEESVNVLKKLAKGVVIDMNDCYCPSVIQGINDRCRRQWRVSRVCMRFYYFVINDPISLLLFILTFIQAFSSGHQFIKEHIYHNWRT